MSCVGRGGVRADVGCGRSGIVGSGGGAGVIITRSHGLPQDLRNEFLLRELFPVLVVAQILLVALVVPAEEPAVTCRRQWECRPRDAARGPVRCS